MKKLNKKELEAENSILHSCIAYLTNIISVKDDRETKETNGGFKYIPFYFSTFTKIISLLKDLPGNAKFIDYGAGCGLMVKYASLLGFIPKGVEINKELTTDFSIEIANLETYEFKKDHYDIVYFYSPFKDREKELIFEIKALQSVKVGGYVIAPAPGVVYDYLKRHDNNNIKGIKGIKLLKELNKFRIVEIEDRYTYFPVIKRIK